MAKEPEIDREFILRKLREMEDKTGNRRPLPKAPGELWPGESMDLGGFTLAQLTKMRAKAKVRRGMA